MYIGEQLGDLSERKLTWAAQLGVEHVAVATPTIRGIEQEDGTWDVAALKDTKDYVASFGIALDVLALNMQSNYMTQQRFPGIMRGATEPRRRDRGHQAEYPGRERGRYSGAEIQSQSDRHTAHGPNTRPGWRHLQPLRHQ